MGFKLDILNRPKGTKSARAEQARRWCGRVTESGQINICRRPSSSGERSELARDSGPFQKAIARGRTASAKAIAEANKRERSERGDSPGGRLRRTAQAADIQAAAAGRRHKRRGAAQAGDGGAFLAPTAQPRKRGPFPGQGAKGAHLGNLRQNYNLSRTFARGFK